MAMGRREKDIKLLVEKFTKLVESLNPGERLSIRKVAAKKRSAVPKAAKGKTPKVKMPKDDTPKVKRRR
ncbi:MAG TPA: hypothetical protein VN815_00055 [Steroidobacteraceae bacterium]|jgi:hypothetical protein|nr:hypothetical protein [Steroidobacteraceae bacterium]